MKSVLKSVLWLVVMLAVVSSVHALSIDITVNPSFEKGEQVEFDYTIASEVEQQVTFTTAVQCPNVPNKLLQAITAKVDPNKPYQNTHTDFVVGESIEPQSCKAVVSLLEPVRVTADKNFAIDANSSFSFAVNTCKDENCNEKSKVFAKGQDIFISYVSEVKNPSIAGFVIFPDNSVKEIKLPTAIEASQSGTYKVSVTAAAHGYKLVLRELQLGVVDKEAEIISASSCNANGVCEQENGESSQSCPQDCGVTVVKRSTSPKSLFGGSTAVKQYTTESKSILWLLGAAGLLLTVLIIIIAVLRARRKPQSLT